MTDLTGKQFGRWTVISFAEKRGKHPYWLCECLCGNQGVIAATNLTRGLSRSCGCLNSEVTATKNRANAIHGQSGNGSNGKRATAEYEAWSKMLRRCRNDFDRSYANYGGRGISVCERWLSFENFYADMGPRPSKQHSLDRVDNDGNYEPDNCRWTTRDVQGRNRRTSVVLTLAGEAMTVTEWAERLNLSRYTIFSRLRKGASAEEALAPLKR